MFTEFYRFFGLSWETSPQTDSKSVKIGKKQPMKIRAQKVHACQLSLALVAPRVDGGPLVLDALHRMPTSTGRRPFSYGSLGGNDDSSKRAIIP